MKSAKPALFLILFVPFVSQVFHGLEVTNLCAFIFTMQNDDHRVPLPLEINAISGA
jgi:hypothetical protein